MRNISPWIIIIALLVILVLFTGCVAKTEIKYVDVPYEVKVPVKCVVPKASCDFNKVTDTEVISSLLECIIDMKHNEKVCRDDR